MAFLFITRILILHPLNPRYVVLLIFYDFPQTSDRPLVEQLDVSVLHVLLVFPQSSLSLLLAGEQSLGIAGGSAVRKVGDDHLLAVSHGAEPLQIFTLTSENSIILLTLPRRFRSQ